MSDDWSGFAIRPPSVRTSAVDLQQRRVRAEHSRVQVQTQVREWIEEQGLQDWLKGTPGLVIGEAPVQALRNRIDQEFKGAERRWAANYLSSGLESGRLERGWTVRVPPRVLVLRTPTPPLNAETFPALTLVGAIEHALDTYWLRCARDKSAVSLEQVLISAIWHSALISQERIRQVASALAQRRLRICFEPQCPWAWVEWTGRAGNWQRLVFDPLTTLLALRWQAQHTGTALSTEPRPNVAPGRRIWTVLERDLNAESLGLRHFSNFLQCAQTRWHYRLPPFLAECARGRIDSACLPPAAWWRWLLGTPLQLDTVPGTEMPAQDASPRLPHQAQASLAPHAVIDIRPLLRSAPQRARQVATRLRAHKKAAGDDPDRLDVVLAQWMIDLLQPQRRKGVRLSSARELLTRVDRRLDAVLGGRVPADAAIWGDALQAIVQATRESQRNNVATALRLLDRSVRNHRCWDGAAQDLAANAQTLVDAQLLSEAEFRAVLDTLQRRAASQECLVAAILGYRCGLRRTEIRGLRWIDVQWQQQPLLLVRSHAGRALKRDSGRRVLPLSVFCSNEELERIRQEHAATQKRIDAGLANRDTVLLLPDPEEPDQPLAETAVFDPVTEAMQAVCGDPALRFHHLRHSAANQLLLQLMNDPIAGAAGLPDTKGAIDAQTIAARRRALVGVGPAQRPLLWAVAAFMGHATPETTLGSYVHLLDALLGLSVRQVSLQPPAEVLGWLVGSTANHVHVLHHRWGVDTAWPDLSAHWVREVSSKLQQSLPAPTKITRRNTAPVGASVEPGAAAPPEMAALLNITDALDLLAVLAKDPNAPRVRRRVSAAQARRIHDGMAAWSGVCGKSPRPRAHGGRRGYAIHIGHLRLDRPRQLQQLRSRELRHIAQAWLDGLRVCWRARPSAIERGLSLHWRLHDSDVHAVAFTKVTDAVRWKKLVDLLHSQCPNAPSLEWTWRLEPSARSPLSAAVQRQRWASRLGLDVSAITCLPSRSFHPSRPAPPLGRLRVQDVQLGKARPGGSLTALDAAAYVMTLSILVRTKRPSP